MAASRKCPERWSKTARRAKDTTELRSSPPILGASQNQSRRASRETSSKDDSTPTNPERITPTNPAVTTPSDMGKDAAEDLYNDTFPEFYQEMFGTRTARGANSSPILVQSSSDPTPMSVDDDSAST